MVLYGTIDSLIDFFSFTAWIFYGGSMVALIVMRYTKPNYPRPYKVCESTSFIIKFLSIEKLVCDGVYKKSIVHAYFILSISSL